MNDRLQGQDKSNACVIRQSEHNSKCDVHGQYHVECVGPDGKVKWSESFDNLVTTVGKNDLLDKYFKGSSYTQTIRMGLKGAGTAAAGDTMSSHAGWTERGGANAPAYTGNRKDVTMNSASSGSSSSPTQAFAITSSGTVDGCFIVNGGSASKDDTTGVLYSVGDFSSAKTVANGDTLNVTYTASV